MAKYSYEFKKRAVLTGAVLAGENRPRWVWVKAHAFSIRKNNLCSSFITFTL